MSSQGASSSFQPGGALQTLTRELAKDARNPQLSYRPREAGALTPGPLPEAPLTQKLEVQLRLPAPLDDFILAPVRLDSQDDVRDLTHMMNHPMIFPTLQTPPYPYTDEHAKGFLQSCIQAAAAAHEHLLTAPSVGELHKVLRGNPFGSIYYEPRSRPDSQPSLHASGTTRTGRSMGQCFFRAIADPTTMDHPSAATPTSSARSFSEVQWYVGYMLDPEFAGRGIMSACVNAQIAFTQAICRLGSDPTSSAAAVSAQGATKPQTTPSPPPPRFLVSVWEQNLGSYRILTKAGFELGAKLPDAQGKKYGFRDEKGSTGVVPEKYRGEPIVCLHLHKQQ